VGLKEVGTLKIVTAIIGMMIVSFLCASPTVASESWTCINMAAGKAVPTKYVVNGKLLIHGDGSAYSKILLNDERLIISFGSFVSNVHRQPKNSQPVEIDEPFVTYFILDKIRSRLLMLDNGAMASFQICMEIYQMPPSKNYRAHEIDLMHGKKILADQRLLKI
jgi:hypothetical protein